MTPLYFYLLGMLITAIYWQKRVDDADFMEMLKGRTPLSWHPGYEELFMWLIALWPLFWVLVLLEKLNK